MYHTIEFSDEFMGELEISPKHWLERLLIRIGTRLRAQIKPYVVETGKGPVEVADPSLRTAAPPAWCLSRRSRSWIRPSIEYTRTTPIELAGED